MTTQPKPDTVVPDGTAAIGAEIRALRKARGMTLNELAEASGVSVSHVSAIERGTVNPSLAKIEDVARALAVPTAWFFNARVGTGPLEREYVVRAENRRNLNMVYGEPPEISGYVDWLLSSSIGGGFYMGLSEFLPRKDESRDDDVLCIREGEQHFVVLEGELVLLLEDEEIVLRAGDSCSIPGALPHHTFNRSDAIARAIWVNAPVILPADAGTNEAETRGNVTRIWGKVAGR